MRVSVAGTPEAEDAMLDARVPQTAAIERSKAKLEVRYDGEPQFKAIEGTGIEYAVNTSSQVLRIDGRYYACDEAVWFVAAQAAGPWGGGGQRARGGDQEDPAVGTRVQRHEHHDL